MYFYHHDYLTQVRQLGNAFGLLLIFDEIATGFCDVTPDIVCLDRALTGGDVVCRDDNHQGGGTGDWAGMSRCGHARTDVCGKPAGLCSGGGEP